MRVVFDTVIIIRGLISPYSWWGRLIFDHADDYQLVVSPLVLTEYLEVIKRPEFTRKYRSVAARDQHAVLEWIATAKVAQIASIPFVSRDPDDDIFFATAKLGNASYLVSEDKDQLDVGEYDGIKVVTAEKFLAILEKR